MQTERHIHASDLDEVDRHHHSAYDHPEHPLVRARDQEDPGFLEILNDIDPILCSIDELLRFIEAARTQEIRAWLKGILDTRRMMGLLVGKWPLGV